MVYCGLISFDSLIWFCASGQAFFAGGVLLMATAILHWKIQRKGLGYGLFLLYTLSILGILMSATALPGIAYLIWGCGLISWIIIGTLRRQYAGWGLCGLIGVSTAVMLLEIPWHITPEISISGIEHIYVIGDSVSAGMGSDEEKTWPELLSDSTGIEVSNLSVAGATARTALKKQVPKVEGRHRLVFLEIGGNDLLNFTSVDEYERCLSEMIGQLQKDGHRIVWFELPSLPPYYAYGRVQRKLANQFDIELVPKSMLASVFSQRGNTSDSIHLTIQGHETMAKMISKLIQGGAS